MRNYYPGFENPMQQNGNNDAFQYIPGLQLPGPGLVMPMIPPTLPGVTTQYPPTVNVIIPSAHEIGKDAIRNSAAVGETGIIEAKNAVTGDGGDVGSTGGGNGQDLIRNEGILLTFRYQRTENGKTAGNVIQLDKSPLQKKVVLTDNWNETIMNAYQGETKRVAMKNLNSVLPDADHEVTGKGQLVWNDGVVAGERQYLIPYIQETKTSRGRETTSRFEGMYLTDSFIDYVGSLMGVSGLSQGLALELNNNWVLEVEPIGVYRRGTNDKNSSAHLWEQIKNGNWVTTSYNLRDHRDAHMTSITARWDNVGEISYT